MYDSSPEAQLAPSRALEIVVLLYLELKLLRYTVHQTPDTYKSAGDLRETCMRQFYRRQTSPKIKRSNTVHDVALYIPIPTN